MTYFSDDHRHLVCLPFSIWRLHVMAADLGIKRCWFHPGRLPHYDIPVRRLEEIRARTVRVSGRDILKIIKGIDIGNGRDQYSRP